MVKGQLNIYKPLGKTSVEMIDLLKQKLPEYSNQTISYAGRLDPMAHGVLVLLVGDEENKARRDREKTDKDYSFTALFGISSDTFDICGLPTLHNKKPTIEEIEKILEKFKGTIVQKIPPYSAYRIKGKPMYVLAANGTLNPEDIPSMEREVTKLNIKGYRKISSKELLQEVKERLALITRGDFRQEAIIKEYEKLLQTNHEFLVVDFESTVSTGTYVRSLCNDIGHELGSGGISIEILRSRSGEHLLKDSLRI